MKVLNSLALLTAMLGLTVVNTAQAQDPGREKIAEIALSKAEKAQLVNHLQGQIQKHELMDVQGIVADVESSMAKNREALVASGAEGNEIEAFDRISAVAIEQLRSMGDSESRHRFSQRRR